MLPRGVEMAMVQVVAQSCEVTELTTNFIASPMHAHCDANRNEYSLIDVQVYNHEDDKANSLTD